ncbi:MAG: hypothetical protein M1568_03300 [Acidobacteria bacterium]|jgi:hypothetical protein|nr:hypothetical protein [Acidobacteriota bacterium]
MSTITHALHCSADKIGIAEITAFVEKTVLAGMGADPFAIERHLEHMGVAASYVCEYSESLGRRPSLFDIVALNGDTVAARIAPDLDREGRAGIAHTMNLFVEHARKLLDEITVTAEEILSGTPDGWSASTRCEQTELDGPNCGSSRPRRVRIIVDLDLDSGPDDGPSGGDPTVTPR